MKIVIFMNFDGKKTEFRIVNNLFEKCTFPLHNIPNFRVLVENIKVYARIKDFFVKFFIFLTNV